MVAYDNLPSREEVSAVASKLRHRFRTTPKTESAQPVSSRLRLACAVSLATQGALSVEDVGNGLCTVAKLQQNDVTLETLLCVRDAGLDDYACVMGVARAGLLEGFRLLGARGLDAVFASELTDALVDEFGQERVRAVFLNKHSDAISLAGEPVAQKMRITTNDLLAACEGSPTSCVEVINALKAERVAAQEQRDASDALRGILLDTNVLHGANMGLLVKTNITAGLLEHRCGISFSQVMSMTHGTPALLAKLGFAY